MSQRLLILDDDHEFNTLLKGIFQQAGYDVLTERDSRRALSMLNDSPVDLVITDYRLPNMDGMQFIIQMKHSHPQVPVIMVSGFLTKQTIQALIKEGVAGIYLKPLNVFSLLKKANELMKVSQNHLPTVADAIRDSLLAREFISLPGVSPASRKFVEKLAIKCRNRI